MGWDIVGAYEKGLCACGSEVGEETWATLLRRNLQRYVCWVDGCAFGSWLIIAH